MPIYKHHFCNGSDAFFYMHVTDLGLLMKANRKAIANFLRLAMAFDFWTKS
jgi:hypothetical protein